MRIELVCPPGDSLDAIRRHTVLLTSALDALPGVTAVARPHLAGAAGDAVLLQYNPFMYGRFGFAPRLPLAALGLRRRLSLVVHEAYVHARDWPSAAMGAWQRTQLTALRWESGVVFSSMEALCRPLGHLPRRRVVHLPVGSNLPDRRGERADARAELGAGETTFVVASFGTGHFSQLSGHVVSAVNAVAAHGGDVVFLNLGAGAPPTAGVARGVRVHEPGALPGEAVARRLAAADVLVAPFLDGVSTRRGSVMAGFQHAVPVVATAGYNTDRVLRESEALALSTAGDAAALAATVVRLAGDADERRRLGAAGRALYERAFDWPVLARTVVDSLAR